jgi:hypothetical protein
VRGTKVDKRPEQNRERQRAAISRLRAGRSLTLAVALKIIPPIRVD